MIIENNIGEEWKDQKITGRFRGRRDRMQRRRGMEEIGNIEEKEIKEVVRKIKNKKAARIDRISSMEK